MPGRAARAERLREQLRALGWNLGQIRQSSEGVTVVLYEVPFQAAHPGVRELSLYGSSEYRAIAAFLEEEIAVRVLPQPAGKSVRTARGVVEIHVTPVAPVCGEEGDEWVIFRRGSAAIPYITSVGTNRTFLIRRREARLINVGTDGRRLLRSY